MVSFYNLLEPFETLCLKMFPTTSCIFHSIDGEFLAEPHTIAVEAWFVMERLVDTLQLGPAKTCKE